MAAEVKRSAQLEKDILANVSHDLRTPLTLIKGYAETVRDLTGGVHARVRPSAAGDAHSLSREGKDGFVQFFLYRGGVFLYLPARIVRPVVGNFQGDLHNSTAPAISPPISTAATKSRQVSLSFLYFVLFLLPA